MKENSTNKDNREKFEKELKESLAAKDVEYWLKSKLIAGFIGAILLFAIAVIRNLTENYEHAHIVAASLGFLAGAYVGERAVFTILGALIAYIFTS